MASPRSFSPTSDLAVLIPVKGRPHRVQKVLDSLKVSTDGCRVLFIPDPRDWPERKAILEAGAEQFPVEGNYARKINQALKVVSQPFLFLGADDLFFHPGWYEQAQRRLTGSIEVVGVNDMIFRRRDHTTHFLVKRSYIEKGTIDERGKLLHEGYQHEFVDDEFVATARKRNAYAYAPNSFVEHLHPDVGKAPTDELYEARPARMRFGKRLFVRRQALWK